MRAGGAYAHSALAFEAIARKCGPTGPSWTSRPVRKDSWSWPLNASLWYRLRRREL